MTFFLSTATQTMTNAPIVRMVPKRRTAVRRNGCTATTSAPTGRRTIRVGDQSIERNVEEDGGKGSGVEFHTLPDVGEATDVFYKFDKIDLAGLSAAAEQIAMLGDQLRQHTESNRPLLQSIIDQNRRARLREASVAATALLRYRYPSTDSGWSREQVVWAFSAVGTREALELGEYWGSVS